MPQCEYKEGCKSQDACCYDAADGHLYCAAHARLLRDGGVRTIKFPRNLVVVEYMGGVADIRSTDSTTAVIFRERRSGRVWEQTRNIGPPKP